MLKNYLSIALRNARRKPGYTATNVAGLAVGMACCLFVFLYVHDERRYDRQHPAADRLYRVASVISKPSGDARVAITPAGET